MFNYKKSVQALEDVNFFSYFLTYLNSFPKIVKVLGIFCLILFVVAYILQSYIVNFLFEL